MNKISIAFYCFLLASSGFCQKAIYQSKAFKDVSKGHKSLAILPFYVILELEHPYSGKDLQRLSEQEANYAQTTLEKHLSLEASKSKRINIQPVEQTNAILKKHQIESSNIGLHNASEVSKLLGVDAVIGGRIITNRLFSEDSSRSYDIKSIIKFKGYGSVAVKITDGQTNKLVWKYEKRIEKKGTKNIEERLDVMMKEVSRKFPYNTPHRD